MKVIVIGNGAVGLSTAYFLQKEGAEVCILTSADEKDNSTCSFGNAGMIVPSHFTPLAAPGVIKDGIKWMFNSKSPFRIKPRFNRDLFTWLFQFMKSANQQNVDRSSRLLLDLNKASRDLFQTIESDNSMDYRYTHGGLMMIYQSAKYQDEEEHNAELAKQFGLDLAILDSEQLRMHESDLEADALGAVWYKSDAHILPELYMNEIRDHLINKGVTIEYGCKVKGFKKRGRDVESVISSKGNFLADEIVVCAGSWTQELAKDLNDSILLQGGKGYHLHIPKVKKQLKTPSILCEARVAVTPLENDLRVSGTMEIAGLDLSIQNSRVEGIKESMSKYFNAFDESQFDGLKPWAGLRPVSPDGLPYIGRSNLYHNLSYNTGHAMMGLSLAPISGKIASDIVLHAKSDYDISILDPNRFKK